MWIFINLPFQGCFLELAYMRGYTVANFMADLSILPLTT